MMTGRQVVSSIGVGVSGLVVGLATTLWVFTLAFAAMMIFLVVLMTSVSEATKTGRRAYGERAPRGEPTPVLVHGARGVQRAYLVSCGSCGFLGASDLGFCARCGYDGIDPASEGSEWVRVREARDRLREEAAARRERAKDCREADIDGSVLFERSANAIDSAARAVLGDDA